DVGWIYKNEWMEYLVDVQKTGAYQVDLRTATLENASSADLYIDNVNLFASNTPLIPFTGAFQTYTNTSAVVQLNAGKHILKVKANSSGFNLNKITFSESLTTNVANIFSSYEIQTYPNPAKNELNIKINPSLISSNVSIKNNLGQELYSTSINTESMSIDVSNFGDGIYFIQVENSVQKIMIVR
ncbi:MAG: carbohydrate-binding protein, partial [Bacteroidetes bacterium]|nr:carbohydrate-binding protein [Bacteroidota bacterium]